MKLPTQVSDAVRKRNPEVFEAGAPRLPAHNPQPVEGGSLERSLKGKAKGSVGTEGRARIRFTIYSMRPCDWDGWDCKQVQDGLVHAGLLWDDSWDLVEGQVRSEKAYSKDEERTEIEIIWP